MKFSYEELRKYLSQGRELHFFYQNYQYSISNNKDGYYLKKFSEPEGQDFISVEELLANGKVESYGLEEIWDAVTVDVLF